jgi:N-acetylmuramoyl-L-alanine amidase
MMVDKMSHWIRKIIIAFIILAFAPVQVSIAQTPQGKYQVMVDAAHGGKDTGVKLSDKYYEKDITLAIAVMLKNELEKSENIRVHLIRTSDKDISLSERKKIFSTINSDVLIVIHVNAGFGKDSSGYELYFPGFTSVNLDKINSKEILEDMAKNKYLNDSVRLAQLIQRNLESVFPRKGRGLRNASFSILEGLKIPAVVLEIGFATNRDDRKKLMDESVRNSIARSLSKSIREYF